MEYTYLYIDDDSGDRTDGTVQGFSSKDYLDVIHFQHQGEWEQQIKFIEAKEKEGKLDGLILDLRLNDYPNSESKKANFRGTTLAQEIRTRQKEGILKQFPIILFSGNDQVASSLENSGKALFDIFIEKEEINDSNYEEYCHKLHALSSGYQLIGMPESHLDNLLKINPATIDERFISELNDLYGSPSHTISRFLINELIEKQGLLVDEKILAARLGVDRINSSDWNKVLESLSPYAKYMGIFSSGWSRWWMPAIEKWWKEVILSDDYLRSTTASKRVELIKERLNLTEITPADKIDKSDSEEFWTICKEYDRPLDPIDGLLIDGQENLYPWQDPEYVSIDAAIKSRNSSKWEKVARLEEDRLRELKHQYRKSR